MPLLAACVSRELTLRTACSDSGALLPLVDLCVCCCRAAGAFLRPDPVKHMLQGRQLMRQRGLTCTLAETHARAVAGEFGTCWG